jgi:hypothetical protein
MTSIHHYTQFLLIEMESRELFAWVGLEPQSSQSLSGITGMSHHIRHSLCPHHHLFFGSTRVWTQGLGFARIEPHPRPSFFALVVFQIGSHAFAWISLKPWPSYFCPKNSWDYKHLPPCLLMFWDRVSLNSFLLRLMSYCGPLISASPSGWDLRHVPLYLASCVHF